MHVLVAYATHLGATREIAERIAEVLAESGVQETLRSVEGDVPVEGYDAFVIGSAIHAGHWLKPAAQFVSRNASKLEGHPVWLFSSGPIGEAADKPEPDPKEIARFQSELTIRGHVVFGGAFDRADAMARGGWLERQVSRFIPEGDFRNWSDIDEWARGIARELKSLEPALFH